MVHSTPSLIGIATRRDGTALVEFALLAPVLLLLLMGMLGFAQYFLVSHSLQQLANDAARAAVAGITTTEREAIARASVAHGLTRLAFVETGAVEMTVDERSGRIGVTLSADPRSVAMLRAAYIELPDDILKRSAVAMVGGVP